MANKKIAEIELWKCVVHIGEKDSCNIHGKSNPKSNLKHFFRILQKKTFFASLEENPPRVF